MTEVLSGRAALPFDDRLRLHVSANLERFTLAAHHSSETRKAAVVLALVNAGYDTPVYGIPQPAPSEAALILTRRSAQLQNHAGQWALPGGMVEKGETIEQAALRELEEEVGLQLQSDTILGRLDDFTTRSGFTISPVVVWAGRDPLILPNPAEVGAVHRIPLGEFMRDDAPVLQSIPESDAPVLLMPVGQGWIATPTGALLYQFREVALRGHNVRVAHFEQPYFAWQ
ncbi:MAG: CoA pyrophosphatase [Desulfopila sp.]|jgi:8-oxo-dGTP pyrophosphatase MutT (NUDIX family)|nr:CoA pyrophosphatase [Desulfopila sp.]